MDEAEREYEIGGDHDSAGREDEAIPHYERALALGLHDDLVPGALLQLGSSLRNVGRNEEAIALFDAAVARFPEHAALRLFRAFALATAGRDREALVDVLDLARTRIDAPEIDRYRRSLEHYTQELGSVAVGAEPWPWPDSLDAVAAAPESHQLLFENDAIRVLETRIARGETTQLHTHRWPGSLYILAFGHFVRRNADGTLLVDSREGGLRPQPGTALWSGTLPPHTLENVDTSAIHVIGVELKNG